MAMIDSAYDYYLSRYAADQKTSRYDSHQTSDLRRVYNSIMKSNKDSPLYKISNLPSATRFAIDIKETSKNIQNVVAALSDNYGEFSNSFQKKVAFSSDESAVSVDYIGNGTEEDCSTSFELRIDQLASPQVNTGNYIRSQALSFIPGEYSFNLDTGGMTYELQYSVGEGDTNGAVVSKLVRLVNSSNLGITASVLENGEEEVALSLISDQTGRRGGKLAQFSITPSINSESVHAMDLLGINHVTVAAGNSQFVIDGTEHTSPTNHFTVYSAFELTLKQTTPEDSPVFIGFKANTDAVADNIQELVDAYNGILDVAAGYSGTDSGSGGRLFSDMSAVSRRRTESLSEIGLVVREDGAIAIDRNRLNDAITPERTEDTFRSLAEFRDAIGQKAYNASVNPMKYVDKVVVEYKNPGHTFPTPYISSIYSGMMLDRVM